MKRSLWWLSGLAVLALAIAFLARKKDAADTAPFPLPPLQNPAKLADLEVLFIGNRMTAQHEVDVLLSALAEAAGKSLHAERLALPGEATLLNHADDRAEETAARIASRQWDVIVLQCASQNPAFTPTRKQISIPGAMRLNEWIRRRGARPLLFGTYAHRDGLEFTAEDRMSFDDMQDQLNIGYAEIGHRIGAEVAPVGISFHRLRHKHGDTLVYEEDGVHANLRGAYLAAATFFTCLYKEDSEPVDWVPEGITPHDGQYLRRTAAEVYRIDSDSLRVTPLTPMGEIEVPLPGGVSISLVRVPAGQAVLGSIGCNVWEPDPDDSERTVAFQRDFWIGRHEVTNAQWRAVMGTKDLSATEPGNLPVAGVTWQEAQDFTERLTEIASAAHSGVGGFRLPSESEWEYAASAGSAGAFSFGTPRDTPWWDRTPAGELLEYAWYGLDAEDGPLPVGERRPNGLGLFDVHGNVFEFVEDDSYDDFSLCPPDGSPVIGNPRSMLRIIRGGSWNMPPTALVTAYRVTDVPVDARRPWVGFRIAADAK